VADLTFFNSYNLLRACLANEHTRHYALHSLFKSKPHKRKRQEGETALAPRLNKFGQIKIYSGTEFGEDFFLEITLILRERRGKF